jgi:FkbM family methyltransferase
MVVPNLVETVGFALGVDGSYEMEAIEVLLPHLGKNLTFVDVGANIGAFTLALAPYAERVIAIEASPAVLPFLRRNVEMSRRSNISIIDYAVSAPGIDSIPFYVPPMDRFGMGSSIESVDIKPIKLSSCTLDDLLRNCEAGRIGAVKIDVEGFEAHVFLGATKLLASDPAPFIIFEFGDWAEGQAFPGKLGWAQEILMDSGYQLWRLPDYIAGRAPMLRPVLESTHAIVARKGSERS